MSQLSAGNRTTLALVAGVVTGTTSIGPSDNAGPAVWNVDTVIMKTTRPGVAPIPRVELYLDNASDPGQLQFLSYDGSFTQASGSCTLTRGQKLIAVWTGGSVGDIAFLTVTGVKQ